jgi:hypothetical protein
VLRHKYVGLADPGEVISLEKMSGFTSYAAEVLNFWYKHHLLNNDFPEHKCVNPKD